MGRGELGKIFADGDVIIAEGSVGDEMYSIQSGEARVVTLSPAGETTLAQLKEGDIFGEMALFDRKPRSASVIAQGETRVLRIDKAKLLTTISRDPTIVLKILESMSQRIRTLDKGLTNLQQRGGDNLMDRLDINSTCEVVLKQTLSLMDADRGYILLAGEDDKAPVVTASSGDRDELIGKMIERSGLAAGVLESGKAELIEDTARDERGSNFGKDVKSLICVPLRFIFRKLGVMVLVNSSRRFTSNNLGAAEALGEIAAIAVQNAGTLSRISETADKVRIDTTSSIVIKK